MTKVRQPALDVALSQLIRRHRVLHDAMAYAETPPTVEETAVGAASPDWRDLADDTDWDAEWPEGSWSDASAGRPRTL